MDGSFILQIKTVQTPFTWEVCTVEKFILVKNKSTYRNCLAVFCPLIGKVDRIFCVWIFHTQWNGVSSFSQGTDIQICFKCGAVIACYGTVVNICFYFLWFSGTFISEEQNSIESGICGRKSCVCNCYIKRGCVTQDGVKINRGFFHNIPITKVCTYIIVPCTSGKNVCPWSCISGILPFIQNCGIVFGIQVRYMHLWKVGNRIVQIVIFIINCNLTPIRNILAEFVLEKKFLTSCALLIQITVRL